MHSDSESEQKLMSKRELMSKRGYYYNYDPFLRLNFAIDQELSKKERVFDNYDPSSE